MQMATFRASGKVRAIPRLFDLHLSDFRNHGGGTPVSITGTGFLAGATVSLEGPPQQV